MVSATGNDNLVFIRALLGGTGRTRKARKLPYWLATEGIHSRVQPFQLQLFWRGHGMVSATGNDNLIFIRALLGGTGMTRKGRNLTVD
jgi:hypothetical protein